MKMTSKSTARLAVLAAFALFLCVAAPVAADDHFVPVYGGYGSTDTSQGTASGRSVAGAADSAPCWVRYDYPKPGYGGNSDAHISADIDSGGTLLVPVYCHSRELSSAGNGSGSGTITH